MEAKELRIGNILNAVVSNGVEIFTFNEIVAHELTKDGMKDEKGFRFPYDTIVGIPLNEWWLLEFGFERSKGVIQNENDKIYRLRDSDDESFYISFGDNSMICIDGFGGLHYVDYVHELQNLYFTLGIQELKLEQS